MRIFSELNLQLAQHDISKDIMNETSKHLTFLSRYYLNDPCVNPLNISVPIVDVPVIGTGGEVVMAHKIALVVHDTTLSSSTTTSNSIASVTQKGGQGDTPTTMEKKDGEVTTGVSAKMIAGSRHYPSSSAAMASPSPSASISFKPRIRVLIQMIGTMSHQKCLIGGLCAIAERVIGGLLEGNEEMVGACEETKKAEGGKKEAGKKPVWDVAPWGDFC